MLRKLFFASTAATLAVVIIACGGAATPAPSVVEKTVVQTAVVPVPQTVVVQQTVVVPPTAPASNLPKGTLTIGLPTNIDTLDPIMGGSAYVESVGMTPYEGLTFLTDKGEIKPLLADSWETPDETTYIFHLHPNVKFHNGEPFNADAVIYTWHRTMETGRVNQYSWDTTKDIQKVDDLTVKITTKAPDPLFLKRMAVDAGSIYPAKYAAQAGDQGVTESPVGTGPFKFKEWVRGDHVTFEANPDYWGGPGAAGVQTLVWKTIADANARIAALQSGEIDIALLVPPAQLGVIMDDPNLKVSRALGLRAFYVMFDNVSSGKATPLMSKQVRQALIYGVDRQAIINAVFLGNGEVINSLIGNAQFGHDPSIPPLPYDVKKAKDLLAQAGYANGFKTSFGCPTGAYASDVEACQAIVGYLKALGLDVTLNVRDANTHWDLEMKKQMDPMYFDGTGDRFADPVIPVGIVMKKDSVWTTWDSPQVQDLLTQGESTTDQAKRKDIYSQMQKIMQDDPPCIPLWQVYNFTALSTRVTGYVPRSSESIIVRGVQVRQ